MPLARRDIDHCVRFQTLHNFGRPSHAVAGLCALLAAQVVLAPHVDCALAGEAESVIRTTLNFRDCKSLPEQTWRVDVRRPRIKAKLTASVVTPRVDVAYFVLFQLHFEALWALILRSE